MSVIGGIVSTGSKILGDAKSGIIGGIRKSAGAYFTGFKQGGFKCLGKQAFHQGDLQEKLDQFSAKVQSVDYNNGRSVADILTYCSIEYNQYKKQVGKYRSPCSRANTEAYCDSVAKTLNEILSNSAFEFEKKRASYPDYEGVTIHHDKYEYVGNKHSGVSLPNSVPNVEIPKMDVEKHDELPVDNLLDNVDPALYTPGFIPPESEIEGLEFVRTTGDPTWNIGGGGRTKDGIDWSFGAGKQQDNTVQLLLIGMFGLLAYKVLFDRR